MTVYNDNVIIEPAPFPRKGEYKMGHLNQILQLEEELQAVNKKLNTMVEACKIARDFCLDDVFDEQGSGTTADILEEAIAQAEGEVTA